MILVIITIMVVIVIGAGSSNEDGEELPGWQRGRQSVLRDQVILGGIILTMVIILMITHSGTILLMEYYSNAERM